MSFFNPFFFLLVDSSLVSTGVGFTGVAVLSAVCAAGVEPGAALSPVVPEALELDEVELETAAGGLLSAGGFAVPDPFRPASTVPLVLGGGGAAVAGALASGAGVLAAGCSDVGWPLSSRGVRISAPTPV
jgi:hypothetical protein